MRKYTELQARVMTALISALIAVPCLFIFPDVFFYVFISLVFGVCAWEWGNLAGFSSFGSIFYGAALASLIALYMFVKLPPFWIISVGLVWWGLSLYPIIVYPKLRSFWFRTLPLILVGTIMLVPSFFAIVALKNHQSANALILSLLVFVWGADIGAFFIGKLVGGTKLCPQVSPGKTWSGLLGGVVVVFVLSLLVFFLFDEIQVLFRNIYFFVLFALFVAGVSVLGDLTVSMFKRARQIKDTGSLLPGHGGFLDRLDSLLSASCVFAIFVSLMQFYFAAV
ncbi:phosphatidate cytidylyltransferase [Gammaproteobacteria bacterium]|nr:phosphatidate cytidylyltransferase [Gammaproteobacteria bacterium]